ncbi:cyclophilin-like fold protein [Acetatifactor muris]|uniref:Cyclophilin-like domain-containing protein n=1 Tax=Acetatifactor muris TaxID=879566 RepID=A0A2K4ZIY0_9FIRM|nr:cyclophilin-like fold protein [Acetatifactor muris]MCR2048580.1 cyclophilin-like fold protein [Acetatifactor muris]SOY30366.1 hypothetical protein AMURIS_03093 [Acetatifactor muris]
MKKFGALPCMVTVIFSMAVCGNIQAQTRVDQAESPMEEGTHLSDLLEESENADVQSEAMDSTETKAERMQLGTISNEPENMTESAADTGDGETVPETEMSETAGTEADIQNGAEEAVINMKVQVGDAVFSATLEENEAVASFVEMVRENPVSIQMSDYSGFEKVGSLGASLPVNNSQTTTHAGDIVLYNGNQIVIFYGSNSWSYTRLGHVDDLTGWEEALGSGDVMVTFSLE